MTSISKNSALYPLLQHYIGSKVTSIIPNHDVLSFETLLGQKGELHLEENGDWKILIGEEIIDTIEGEVFNALVNPDVKVSLEEYLDILRILGSENSVSYRSRILVMQILKVLGDYILSSPFVPKNMITIGPFIVFSYKGDKFINCLN